MASNELDQHPFDRVQLPSDLSPAGLRAWLARICRYLDVSPTELARTAEIAPSTVNKFLVDTEGKKSLSARTLSALQRAALDIQSRKFGKAYYPNTENDPRGFFTAMVMVGAELRAFVFKDQLLWPLHRQFHIQIPVPNTLRGRRLVGFLITDNHAEQSFPYATTITAAKFEGEPLEVGEFLIVSRLDHEGRTELTVRHFTVSPNGDMWLTSQSRRGDRLTDIYVGKTESGWMTNPPSDMKFSLTPNPDYTVEYKVISAVSPVSYDYAALKFPE